MTDHTLSIIVPCYNEENTLARCIERVMRIGSAQLRLEVVIVDDCSTDASLALARCLQKKYSQNVVVCSHEINQGKGAAIRTGMQHVTGDFVAIQDADLEYDPLELLKLIEPLKEGRADAVFGSRYLSAGVNRVLYFWHTMGNKFLTFLSNMFTDLNLTDMETCYKVFRRDKVQQIKIEENRFGFEPEIVAKAAQLKLRIYEMGISYDARTYDEGKKIGWRDGFRALYCIFHYNAFRLPMPMQFMIYFFLGGFSALINLSIFIVLFRSGMMLVAAASISFFIASIVNYKLCIHWLFRQNARWSTRVEVIYYSLFALGVCALDVTVTQTLSELSARPVWSKAVACVAVFIINFVGRRFFIFRQRAQAV